MTRGKLVLAGIALLILLVGGVMAARVWTRPAVAVATSVLGPAVEAVYATGVVEPTSWARVAPLAVGRIVEINARDGLHVEKGQVLARIDDKEAQARLREIEALEKFRREELERFAKLSGKGAASRQALERAASDYAQAKAAAAAARQRVANLTLTAPMAGVVLRQDGEIGEVVEPGKTLFWIGRPRPLRVIAEVDEEDIPRVKPGQTVHISADAFPGQALEGFVFDITPKGDPVSKNYRVRINLPDTTPLLVGMTVELNIVVRRRDKAVLVPAGAVRDGRVWVLEDGVVRARRVTAGSRGNGRVEIRSGLEAGAAVVVDPPEGLTDGDKVRAASTTKP